MKFKVTAFFVLKELNVIHTHTQRTYTGNILICAFRIDR